jgi:preprotein translocase subunit YajC
MERENGMNRAKSLGLILVASAFLAAVTSVAHSQDAPKTSNDVPVLEKSQVDEEDSGDVAGDTVGDKAGDKAAGTGRVKVGKKKPPGGLFGDQTTMLVVMVGGMLLLFFWMGRGKRKQESKRRQMLAGLKKGDKVTSIGGIVGTIIEVRESEVTMKVDENNNIRMRFARWAIRGIGEEAKEEKPEDRK